MLRTLAGIAFGAATVAGGIYLYKKYGRGRRKAVVAHVAGAFLGEKLGETAGYVLAGPAGAVVGGVFGAVSGAIAAEDYLQIQANRGPELVS